MIYYFQYIFQIFILLYNIRTKKRQDLKNIHVGPNIVSSWIMYFKLLKEKKT